MTIIYIILSIPVLFILFPIITELFTPNSGKKAEMVGFSQGQKEYGTFQISDLEEDGFNLFAFEEKDVWLVLQTWLGMSKVIFSVGALWKGYIPFYALNVEYFYNDEPYTNSYEAGYSSLEDMVKLEKERKALANSLGKDYVLGAQTRLWEKYKELFPDFKLVQSSYLNAPKYFYDGQPFVYVYGNFCYWHFFQSLRYKHIKREAEKHGIKNFVLYQGDQKWHETFLNNYLRKRFINVFKEAK